MMKFSAWLWQWIQERRTTGTPADPLARFANLTLQRLEDRRVLSVTAPVTTGDVQIIIDGDDFVTLTVTGNILSIDGNDADTDSDVAAIDLTTVTSLTISEGAAGAQSVVFAGATPFDLGALAVTSGIDSVAINQNILADQGGISIDVTGSVTIDANVSVSSTAGNIDITADVDITMASGSSLSALDVGETLDISLIAGDDLTVASVHASDMLTLQAGSSPDVDGSLVSIEGQLTTDVGDVSITGADDVRFTADGDVTVTDGSLTVHAGTDAGDDLTMVDGAEFSVTSLTTATVELSAGGDIQLGSITGTNLSLVTITAGEQISDGTTGETANVTADSLALLAGSGIGATGADDIDTAVANIEALTVGGGIFVGNTGALTIGGVNGMLSSVDITGMTGGAIAITATGSLTVSEGISGPGNIDLVATGASSDLTISVNSGVTSTGGDILLAADQTVTISENVGTTGTGSITVTGHLGAMDEGARNIVVNSGAVVSTEDGDLTVDADQGTQQTGSFAGIRIDGANTVVQSTGSGDVVLSGRGGDGLTGSQFGVVVETGAVVKSDMGMVSVTGTGGTSAGEFNHGVLVQGAGSAITSGGGNLTVTGFGGGTGAAANNNVGVYVLNGEIAAGGTGGVTVNGTGGATVGIQNYGVFVEGTGATITSHGGNVSVTGQGGGAGASAENLGVFVQTEGVISAGGMGTVTVQGTGGATGGNNNYGVLVNGTGSQITSSGGAVQVTGQGGGTGATSQVNVGVYVAAGGAVTAGTTGTVTVNGTGGAGGGDRQDGVLVDGAGSVITSGGGNVSVTGFGGGLGTSANNVGVHVSTAGMITAGGSGAVTVNGTGGVTTGAFNHGVAVDGVGSAITSSGGAVSVIGQGGGAGVNSNTNYGVSVVNATITAGGTASVTVNGTGGTADGVQNFGVSVIGTGAAITSSGGNVMVTGLGGGTGVSAENHGVVVDAAGQISAVGLGTVTVHGTGGATTGNNNYGVLVNGSSTQITSSGGAVSVTGQGGGSSAATTNVGVYVAAGGTMTAGGTGTVTIDGTGGATTGNDNYGVFVQGAGSAITSGGGAVQVTGIEGDGTTGYGIVVGSNGAIRHTANGNVTLVANSMAFDNTAVVSAGAGTVTIRQLTDDVEIDLGSGTDTVGGPLSLSDAELDRITAGTLVIGDASSGAITVSADIDLTDGPVVGTLCLATGSTVTATAGGIIVSSLAITAGGAVSITDASTNVANLAIETTSGDVTFTEASGLTITTVKGVHGVSTDGGSVTINVTAGNLILSDTSAADDISATTGVTLALAANNAQFTSNSSSNIGTTGGGVSIAADKMSLQGTIVATGQKVTLQNGSGADAIRLGSTVDNTTNALELSDAELDRITANTLVIGSSTAGAITTVTTAISPANVTELHLVTGSTVTATAALGFQVAKLAVTAGGNVNLTATNNDVSEFAAVVTGTLSYTDTNAFTIGTVDGVVGVQGTSTITLTATAGQLTIGTGTGEDIVSTGAAAVVTLTAPNASGIVQNAGSTVVAPNLRIVGTGAAGGSFVFNEDNDVDVIAAAVTGNLEFTDIDDLTVGTVTTVGINTGGGDVTLNVGGLLTIGTGAGQDIVAANATVIITSAGVTENANSIINADELLLQGTGTFQLGQANTVNTVAADVTGSLSYTDANAFVIGTVNGISGIDTHGNELTLRTTAGGITQQSGTAISASGLLIMGAGTFTLTEAANDVDTIAISSTGDISYTDADALSVGTVAGVNGINAANRDVTLKTINGDLSIDQAVALGTTGDFTLDIAGNVTQATAGTITTGGLALLGTGTVTLENTGNTIVTLAADHIGSVSLVESSTLVVGTVNSTVGVDVTGDLTLVVNAGTTTVSQNVTLSGTLDLTAGAAMTVNSGVVVDVGADILLDVTGLLTVNGDLLADGALESGGAGGLTLNSSGSLEATNIALTHHGVVSLGGGILAAGNFSSTGNGTFAVTATGSIDADGMVMIDHVGTVTLANDVTGGSVAITSDSTSANAVFASVAGVDIVATGGDLQITATNGSLNLANAALAATDGSITLMAADNISVRQVTTTDSGDMGPAEDFTSTAGGTFTLGSGQINVVGAVVIDHTGTVTLASDVTGGSVAITSDSTSANAVFASVAGVDIVATGGDLQITATAGGLNLVNGTLAATDGSITLMADDNISVLKVTTLDSDSMGPAENFSSTAGGTFTLGAGGINVVGDAALDHDGTVTLNGTVTAGNDFTSTGAGAFTQNAAAAIDVGGNVELTHNGAVALNGAVMADGSFSSSGNGTFALNNGASIAANGITLAHNGTSTITGTATSTAGFSATGNGDFTIAAGGSILATGGVLIDQGGALTFSGAVTGSSITLDAGDTTALAVRAVTAAAVFTATTGDIAITSAGGISLAVGDLSATGGDITLMSGTQAVIVGDVSAGGAFSSTGGGTFSTSTGTTFTADSIAIDHAGLITLNTTLTAATTVMLTAGAGVTEAAGGVILADDLLLMGTGTFTLTQANDVNVIAAHVTGSVTYNDIDTLSVGTASGKAGVNTNGNALTLTTGGQLTIGDGAEEDITAAGATVTLNAAAGGVVELANSVITAGSLRLLGAGTFDLNQGNDVGTLAADISGALIYQDVNALTIGTVTTVGVDTHGNDVTLTVGGLLTVGSGAGQDITATGATVTLNAAGVTEAANSIITANELLLTGTGTYTLTQANSVSRVAANVTGPLSFTNTKALEVGSVGSTNGITTGGGMLTINNAANSLTVAQAISTGTGSVTLTAGATTINAGVTTSNAGISVTGTTVNVNAALSSSGGNVDLTATGLLTLNANVDAGAGDITLTLSAGATQSSGSLLGDNLAVNGAGTAAVALNSATNDVASLTASYGGPIAYTDANGLNTGAISTSNDDVTLTVLTGDLDVQGAIALGTGDLTLDVRTGNVTETTGSIVAAGLLLTGGNGATSVVLDGASNNVATLAAMYNGAITYVDLNALAVGTVGGVAGITTSGHDVSLTAGGLLTIGSGALGQDINAGSATVCLDAAGVTELAGATIIAGELFLTGTGTFNLAQANDVDVLEAQVNGALTFNDTDDLTIGTVKGPGGVNTTGNAVTLSTGNLLTIGDGGGEDIVATGAIVTLNTTAGGVTEESGSVITAASLRLLGTGTFDLNEANNVNTLAADVVGSLTYRDADALTIGTVTTVGVDTHGNDLTLNVGGLLTIGSGAGQDVNAGAGTVCLNAAGVTEAANSIIVAEELLLQGAGTYTLTQANEVATFAAAVTGAVSFTNTVVLEVGSVKGVDGITTNGGTLTIANGANSLTVSQAISTGAGSVSLTAGATTINADVTTAANGNVAISGTAVDINAAVTTGGAGTIDVTASSTLNVDAALTTAGGDIALTATGLLTLTANVDAMTGDVTLTLGAGATQTGGAITADGLLLLGTGAATLNQVGNNVTTLAANYNGTIAYTDANTLSVGMVGATSGITTSADDVKLTVVTGDLTLDQAVLLGTTAATSGDLTLDVRAGNITQTAAIRASGLQLLGAGGDVTLTTATNDVVTLAANRDGAIAYTDANALTVGTVTDEASGMTFSGITTLDDHVTLNVTTGGLVIDDVVSLGAGNLTLNVGGAVTQNAGDAITAAGLELLGTGTVRLNDAANDVDVIAANYNGTISFTDLNTLTVGTVNTVGVTTSADDVTLIAGDDLLIDQALALAGGDLTLNVTGDVTQSGTGAVTANGLRLLGSGTVNLNHTTNNVTTLAANYNGTIAYTDADALSVGSVADNTQTAAATSSGITTSNGDVKLTVAANGLVIDDDIALGTGDLTLNVVGAVTQNSGDSITAGGLQLLGAGVVTLTDTGNNVARLAANYDGAIAYTDANALTVGTVTDGPSGMTFSGITTLDDHVTLNVTTGGLVIDDEVSLGAGNLTLNVGGAVTQNTGDAITAAGLELLGTGTVTLNDLGNNVTTLAANYNGTIAYTDADTLSVGTVGATSGITTSADDVKLTVVAGDLTLDQAVLLGTTAATSGDLTLDVQNGNITQTAAIRASGLLLTNNTMMAGGTVTLTNAANDVVTLAANWKGVVSYADANALTVGTVTDGPSGMTFSGVDTNGNNLILSTGGLLTIGSGAGQGILAAGATVVINTTSGGVTEQAGSTITAANLLLTGAGTYTLAQANDVDVFAADVTGAVTFNDADDLEVGTVNGVNGISTGNPANGGSVTITSVGDLTVNQSINTTAGAGGAISISGATINAALVAGAGDINLTGGNQDLIINVAQSSAATMTLSATRDVIINAAVTTTGAGADILVTADLDSDGVGGVQVTAIGQLRAADAITVGGSDLSTTMALDSVRIDADGTNDQLLAGGLITIQHRAAAPVGADIVIDGRIHSTDGDIVIDSRDVIEAQSAITADDGDVTFQDAVVLTGDLLVTAGGAATFNGAINDDANMGTTSALTVTAAGTTRFNGAIGSVSAIDELTTDGGGTTEICGNVTTIDGQTYTDAVVLCGNVTLASMNSGDIHFVSTVNSDATAARSLTVETSGVTRFDGSVGQTRALASLTTDMPGDTQISGGLIRTTGAQTFNDNVLLTANTQFVSTAAGTAGANITVNGTLTTGGNNVTVDAGTQGDITFADAISGGGTFTVTRGDIQQFESIDVEQLTISAATTSVTFHGLVDVMNGVSVISSGSITQESTLDAGMSVSFAAGTTVSVKDELTAGTNVTITSGTSTTIMADVTAAGGTLEIDADTSIASTGALLAGVDVDLDAGTFIDLDNTVTATTGDFTASAGTTITADQALTAATSVVLTSTSGTTLAADADVMTTATGGLIDINGPLTTAADFSTDKGTITLSNAVTLTGDVVWDSDHLENGGANILVQGSVATGGRNLTMDAGAAGDVTTQQSISGGGTLTIEQSDAVRFSSSISVTNLDIQQASSSVTFTGAVTAVNDVSVNSDGTIAQNSTVMAGNDVDYLAAGAITVDGALTAGSDVTIESTAADVLLLEAVTARDGMNGGGSVTVTAFDAVTSTDFVTADGNVTMTAGGTLTVSGGIDAGHDVTLTSNGSNISASGGIVAGNDVTIDADTSLLVSQAISADQNVTLLSGTATTLTATIKAENGDLSITSDTSITASQMLTAGRDIIVLADTTVNLSGDVDAGRDLSVTATTLSMSLSGVIIAGRNVATSSGTSTAILDTITAQTDVTISAGTSVTQVAAVTATDGTLDITAGTTLTASQLFKAGVDVLIEAGSSMTVSGPVMADRDVSLTSTGSSVSLSGATTVGNDLSIDAFTSVSVSDTVVATENIMITAGTSITLLANIEATKGDLTTMSGTSTTSSQTLTAGTDVNVTAVGLVSLTGMVEAKNDVHIDSQASVSLSGGVAAGNDVIVSAGSSTSISDFVTAQRNIEIDSGTSVSILDPVTAMTGSITVTAGDNVTASGALDADDNITITSGGLTSLTGSVTAGVDLSITSTLASISLSGVVNVENDVFLTSATSTSVSDVLTAGSDIAIDAGTSIGLTGELTATTGSISALAGTSLTSSQTLMAAVDVAITTGGLTSISGFVEAGQDVTIDSGASISLSGGVDAGRDVILDSVSSTTVSDAVTAQRHVMLTAGTSVGLTAPITAATGNITASAGTSLTSSKTLMAAIDVDITTGGLTSISGFVDAGQDFVVNSGASISLSGGVDAGRDVMLDAATSTNVSDPLTAERDVAMLSGSSITLTAPITATTGNITLQAGTSLTSSQTLMAAVDVAITTGGLTSISGFVDAGQDFVVNSGASISLSGGVDAGRDVMLDAATSTNVSDPLTAERDVAMQSGTSITLTAPITAATGEIQMTAGTSLTSSQTLFAATDITIMTGGLASFTNTVTADDDISIAAGSTLTATQLITAADAVTMSAGTTMTLTETADVRSGAGGVTLTATDLLTAAEITTSSGNVAITAAVTLIGDVTIDTGVAGDITVTGGIDADDEFVQSLFLSAGTGDVTVTGDIGVNSALNDVVVTDVTDVMFGGGISADRLLQVGGLGTTTIVGGVNTFGGDGIQLTTSAIQFAAGTSSMDSHGNIITLTADSVTLPTTFTNAIGSTVTLQTLTAGTAITLGDALQGLHFNDTQLDTIHAANLIMGSTNQTAGITVAGDASISIDENLTLLTANSVAVLGALSATADNVFLVDAGNDIVVNGTVSTITGDLTLAADDDIVLGSAGVVQSTSGDVSILADANLDANGTGGGITFANGSVVNSGTGALTIQADEDIVISQIISSNSTAGAMTLTSLSGGIIDGGDAGVDILLINPDAVLTINAVTGVGSATGSGADAALETQVNHLVVVNSSTGAVNVDEVDAITIRGVEQNGTGSVTLTSGGTMIVQPGGPGIQTQGGDITVRTTGSASHLELHATVNSRGGSVGMQIGGGVTMAAAASISTSGGDFAALAGGAWTMADQSIVNTAAGTIRLEAGGDITVGQFATTNGTASAVLLRSTGGGIVDGGDSGGVDILANSAGAIVTIEAATGVGSTVGNGGDAAIESQIDTLVLRNASAGNVQLDEVDNLRIHELTQTGAGDVTVNSVGNLLLVGGQLGLTATSGTVTLSAAAAASTMTIESKVQTTSGNVVISAANDVMMGATSQIVSQSGNVTVIADADANVNGLGGQIFMANGAVIDAGSGNITARADENITVGRMVTASTVSLTSTSAGIVDGGDAGGADIAANALVMQTRTGIGAANTLETAVSLLAANNTASGAIQINNNTGGLLTIGQVGDVIGVANAGSTAQVLDIVNNGGITVNGAVRNSTGGDVDLTANANGGGDDHLTVNAVIAAANGNGDVFLTAGNNLIINDSGNGGGDDISVVNGGEILGSAGGDVLLGEDVVIRSSTGVVTGTQVDPVLIDVITPQINALGIGTITMTVQEPLEVGTVIVIDWGDGTIETFVVTDPGELTLTFTHTYTAPPDPGNPAADIPLKVTVLNPSFTTGLAGSGVAGTVLIDNGPYVPNIRFAAGGDVLGANDVGVLNQAIYTGVFKTPGEGLASFVFDVTPEVQILDFPQPSSPDASLLAAPQPPAQQNTLDVIAARAEELLADERVVILEVLGPDGELIETVVLSESVLDDIDGVVADLPNGNYRFLLREAGESQTRLLQDVDVHEGKIVGDSDSMLLRPRSLRRTAPLDAMTTFDRSQDATEGQSPPADALNPDNSVTNKTVTDDGVTDNSAADHRFVNNSSDGEPAVNSWSARRAWRRALAAAGEMHHDEGAAAQSDLVGDETGDGHLRVGPMAAPMSVRPSGFGRAARLMRLHGAP